MQGAISLLSRIDGFTARRLSGYGRHSLIACGGANKLLYSLKDPVRIMHSHTTRAQAARPAVSAAAVRQRRLRCACRLALGRILALSRAPVVLARRLPRPLTLGLKARARAVEVLVAQS